MSLEQLIMKHEKLILLNDIHIPFEDKQTLQSGTFRVPVLSKSDNVTIEIQNAKHLPCRFQSAEYEGFLVVRSPRGG